MKKSVLLFIVFIFCIASLTHAGTLTITKNDLGGSKVAIGYSASSADCIPVAFALQCILSSGSVSPSSVLSFSEAFNAFPDYLFSNPDSYIGQGMPLAKINTPGSLIGSAGGFSICMSAFQYHETSIPSPADINRDGFVGWEDVQWMIQDWLALDAYSDLNGDRYVDIRDFALLSEGLAVLPLKEDALVVLQLPQGLNANDLNITADTLRGGAAVFNSGINCSVVFVPEPASALLMFLGAVWMREKRKR